MSKVTKFLKDWQDVCDGNTPAAREFRSNPDNAKHIKAVNWVITITVCLGMLYMFTSAI